jgi:hypothetical protein
MRTGCGPMRDRARNLLSLLAAAALLAVAVIGVLTADRSPPDEPTRAPSSGSPHYGSCDRAARSGVSWPTFWPLRRGDGGRTDRIHAGGVGDGPGWGGTPPAQ